MYRFCLLLYGLFVSHVVLAERDIERVGEAISHPWGMDAIDERTVLVTSRQGSLFKIDIPSSQTSEVRGIPDSVAIGQGGLLDVVVRNSDIYLCYTKQVATGRYTTAIFKAFLKNDRLSNGKDIFVSNHSSSAGYHFGCRLVIHDDELYASLGDRGDRFNAQMPDNHAGSIIRISLTGTAINSAQDDWLPEIHSIGHRNPQGMTLMPNGELWAHEHGPQGGDEINVIQRGRNYGWPVVSYGEEYGGGEIGLSYSPEGYTDPIWTWVPSIAPSGMSFYSGDMFPEIKGSLLVGSLKFRRIYSVKLNEKQQPISESIWLDKELGRIRDIAVMKDGSILVLNDQADGGLYRITEVKK